MATGSNTLARIQGRGLSETTTADVTQAGMPLAVSPLVAASQSRGPDSAKMAGTSPSKINALRTSLQDSDSARLAGLRQTAQQDFTADKRVTDVTARAATVAGRLDEAMAGYISEITQLAFAENLKPPGAQLKENVYKNDQASRDSLQKAIDKLLAAPATFKTEDLTVLQTALKLVDPQSKLALTAADAALNAKTIATTFYENLTPAQLSQNYANTVTKIEKNTDIADFLAAPGKTTTVDGATVTLPSAAQIFAESAGLTKTDSATGQVVGDTDALKQLLTAILPAGADFSNMKLADITAAVQNWREAEFRDVAAYEQVLQNPNASKAQHTFALENLRRLGKVNILALDQKIGNLEAQMRDGDVVRIGGGADDKNAVTVDIEKFFTDPASLAQLEGWLSKPDTAPASLRPWLQGNQTSIQSLIDNLDPGLRTLADRAKTNADKVAITGVWKPDDELVKEFFGDLTDPGLDDKYETLTADQKMKFELLQDDANSGTGAIMSSLMTALSIKSPSLQGTGVTGKQIFEGLSAEDLKKIVGDPAAGLPGIGVAAFIDNIVTQKYMTDFANTTFNPATAAGDVSRFLSKIGLEEKAAGFERLVAASNLNEFRSIFKNAGLSDTLITADGKFNIAELQTEISKLTLGKDVNLSKLHTQLTDLKTELSKTTDANKIKEINQKIKNTQAQIDNFVSGTNTKGIKEAFANKLDKLTYTLGKPPIEEAKSFAEYEKQYEAESTLRFEWSPKKELAYLEKAVGDEEAVLYKKKQEVDAANKEYERLMGVKLVTKQGNRFVEETVGGVLNNELNALKRKHSQGLIDNLQYIIEASKISTKMTAATRARDVAQDMFTKSQWAYDARKDDLNAYKDKLPEHEAAYQKRLSEYVTTKTTSIEKKNAKTTELYDKLFKLIGGIA